MDDLKDRNYDKFEVMDGKDWTGDRAEMIDDLKDRSSDKVEVI